MSGRSDAGPLNDRSGVSGVLPSSRAWDGSVATRACLPRFVWSLKKVRNYASLRRMRQGLFHKKLCIPLAKRKCTAEAVPINNQAVTCAGAGPIEKADIEREIGIRWAWSVGICSPVRRQFDDVKSDIHHRRA